MKKVAIIICNYNKEDTVLECIQCILEQKYTDYDIYVVDNASTDNSVQRIRQTYGTRVNLIEKKENTGGSGGFNAGLRIAYAKEYTYLMCVDNDAMLDENAVGCLVAFLDSHEEAGMAASKINHLEDPDYIQQFGQTIDFKYFCTSVPHLNMLDDGSLPEYLYVDSAAACSLMVRRTTIEKIGFLPEENFLYWDDTEWCYLCNRAGMKVASVSASTALHAMGAKREDVSTFPTYYAWRNWIRFFCRYTPKERWEQMTEAFLDSIFSVVYAGIHKGEYNRMKTVMLAYDDAIHGITGKAGANRIFDVDFHEEPFRKLFASANAFYIEENDFPSLAEWLIGLPKKLGISVNWTAEPVPGARIIALCEDIFRLDDLGLSKVYVDIDRCIFQSEEDALDIINYNYSRRSFLDAQKPVFLQKLSELSLSTPEPAARGLPPSAE